MYLFHYVTYFTPTHDLTTTSCPFSSPLNFTLPIYLLFSFFTSLSSFLLACFCVPSTSHHITPPHLILSHLISSHSIPNNTIHSILSYPILSYPILSYPILSYPILSGWVVSEGHRWGLRHWQECLQHESRVSIHARQTTNKNRFHWKGAYVQRMYVRVYVRTMYVRMYVRTMYVCMYVHMYICTYSHASNPNLAFCRTVTDIFTAFLNSVFCFFCCFFLSLLN